MAQVSIESCLSMAHEVAAEVKAGKVKAENAALTAAQRLGLKSASAFHTKLNQLRKHAKKPGATFTVPSTEVFPTGKRGRQLDIGKLNSIGAKFKS